MLFPLTLAAFEEYLLADDRPDYPMDFFLKLSFQGCLRRSILQEAVDAAIARHPLLSAVVQGDLWGRSRWVAAEQNHVKVAWDLPGWVETCGPIDLSREVGLRICGEEADKESRLWFQFHHVCCDGLGALRFAEDVLACYDAMVGGTGEARLRPVDPTLLRHRDRFSAGWRDLLSSVPREWFGLLGAVEYFAHRPVRLASAVAASRMALPEALPQGEMSCSASLPGVLRAVRCRRLGREETAACRRAAKRLGCTTNDLLLGALYVACDDWIARHGRPDRAEAVDEAWSPALRRLEFPAEAGSATGWAPSSRSRSGYLRIMIPTNLRGETDHAMPSANRVSMVFLDRRPRDFATPAALLASIAGEMRRIKRWRLGLSLLSAIRLFRKVPGGIRRMLPADGCLSTTMLTNLLDPTVHFRLPRREGRIAAGDVVLENVEGFAPLRPGTPATFAAIFYAHRLSICMSIDPRWMTTSEAESLLDGLVERLQDCIADKERRTVSDRKISAVSCPPSEKDP